MSGNIKVITDEVGEEHEAYLDTFGTCTFRFDTETNNDCDVPTNVILEITRGDDVLRASVNAEVLLDTVRDMKKRIDEGNYPRWLDESPLHIMTDGTPIRVDEVRYNPWNSAMTAVVSVYDRNMRLSDVRTVPVSGRTDRKALARRLPSSERFDEPRADRLGYVVWHVGDGEGH